MKKINTLLAASVFAATAVSASADSGSVTANAGFVTDYYYRGLNLGDAGMYAGLDYELGGFSAGAWAINDNNDDIEGGNDGLEVDFYASYGFDVMGVDLGIGYTRYEYTYTSNYEAEVNLSASYGAFTVDYANGTAHEEETADDDVDYIFYSLNWSNDIFSATWGHMEADEPNTDDQYEYFEVSASGEFSGFDITATIGKTTDVVGVDEFTGEDLNSGDGYMTLDISKSFDL